MKGISQAEIAKFAGLVAKVWGDPNLEKAYIANPAGVLAQHGITLPAGVPTPVIPAKPAGDLGKAWQHLSFDNWDLTIQPLAPGAHPQAKISSLCCYACPVSSFSSVSN